MQYTIQWSVSDKESKVERPIQERNIRYSQFDMSGKSYNSRRVRYIDPSSKVVRWNALQRHRETSMQL